MIEENENIGGGAEPPATMSDTAGDAYDQAFAGGVTDDTGTTPEPPPAAGRDERGRFAAKDQPASDTGAAQTPGTEPPPPADQTAPDIAQPPSSWRAEARQGWETLPEHVRSEVWRREQDMHAGFAQYRDAATFGGEFARALAPYADTIRAAGVTPAQAAAELFQLEATLRGGGESARNALHSLAKSYGIDLGAAPGQGEHGQQQAAHDPTIRALEQRIAQLTQFVQGQQQQTIEEQERAARDEIEAFRGDAKYQHFEALRPEMSRLLTAGLARDLADAYEQASWRVPAVREKVLAARQEAERKEAERRAAEAKAAASVNVPRRGTPAPAKPVGKMEDTIGAAWDSMMRG